MYICTYIETAYLIENVARDPLPLVGTHFFLFQIFAYELFVHISRLLAHTYRESNKMLGFDVRFTHELRPYRQVGSPTLK